MSPTDIESDRTRSGELELVSPALELATARPAGLSAGLEDLTGLSVGLVDNGKWNAAELLRRVQTLLAESFGTVDGPTAHKQHYNRDLTEGERAELKQGAQVALAAIGDCGSCTSYTVRDALVLEAMGVPAVAIVTAPFLALARGLAKTMGTPGIRLVAIPHPLYGLDGDQLAARARQAVDDVAGALMEHRR